MKREGEIRIPSGCAISAVISREGTAHDRRGEIMQSIDPDARPLQRPRRRLCRLWHLPAIYSDFYALHIFFDDNATRRKTCEALLKGAL